MDEILENAFEEQRQNALNFLIMEDEAERAGNMGWAKLAMELSRHAQKRMGAISMRRYSNQTVGNLIEQALPF